MFFVSGFHLPEKRNVQTGFGTDFWCAILVQIFTPIFAQIFGAQIFAPIFVQIFGVQIFAQIFPQVFR